MIPAGLSSATLRAFQSTLLQSHEIQVTVTIQDLSGNSLADVSNRLTDGQVNIDGTAAVTRSATVTLLDADRSLPFDSSAPADAALYVDRMIHIVYGVLVGSTWVRIPVFTGPVTKLDRSDSSVNVEAQGKESLAGSGSSGDIVSGACWSPISLAKGMLKTDAIVHLLHSRSGEVNFSIPALSSRLAARHSLPRDGVPWTLAQQIARSMNRQLYYTGDGVCRLRTPPGTTQFTFTDPGSVTSAPQISYTTSEIANTVWVIGATPNKPTTSGGATQLTMAAPTWTEVAPQSHPLSPYRLARNGVPYHLLKKITDDTIVTRGEAKALAQTTLAQSLLEAVDVSFEALPIPHLDPGDLCALASSSASTPFRFQKASLPLVAGPAMTVGMTRNLAVRPRRVNR